MEEFKKSLFSLLKDETRCTAKEACEISAFLEPSTSFESWLIVLKRKDVQKYLFEDVEFLAEVIMMSNKLMPITRQLNNFCLYVINEKRKSSLSLTHVEASSLKYLEIHFNLPVSLYKDSFPMISDDSWRA